MTPETAIIGTVESAGADVVPLPSAPLPAVPLPEAVREYVRASKAENTFRGYQSDWRDFRGWCESHGSLCPLGSPQKQLHRLGEIV